MHCASSFHASRALITADIETHSGGDGDQNVMTPRLPFVFNLQGSELVIILLLALVVLGPEKLPDAMRKAGQFYAELKKMSTGFQTEFRAAVEEPLRELRDTANTIRDSADFTKLQNGEREEKPKSADMVAAADPSAVPTDNVPFESAAAPAAPEDRSDNPVSDNDDHGNDDVTDDDVTDDLAADPIVDDPQNQVPFSSVVISNPTPQRKHVAFARDASATPSSVAPVDESTVAEADSDPVDQTGVLEASIPRSDGDDSEPDPSNTAAVEPAQDAAAEQPE